MKDTNLFGEQQEYKEEIQLTQRQQDEIKIKAMIKKNGDYAFLCGENEPPIEVTKEGFDEFCKKQMDHLIGIRNTCKTWQAFNDNYYYI